MSLYLDTSLIVSAFTNEVLTARARAFFHENNLETKLISWRVQVELAAAISAKSDRALPDKVQRQQIAAEVDAFIAESVTCVGVEEKHFTAARTFAERAPGLRAGDALHLAIAAAHEATVCTLDRGMAAAAETLGLGLVLIGADG